LETIFIYCLGENFDCFSNKPRACSRQKKGAGGVPEVAQNDLLP
jgi:hypothetical protein